MLFEGNVDRIKTMQLWEGLGPNCGILKNRRWWVTGRLLLLWWQPRILFHERSVVASLTTTYNKLCNVYGIYDNI